MVVSVVLIFFFFLDERDMGGGYRSIPRASRGRKGSSGFVRRGRMRDVRLFLAMFWVAKWWFLGSMSNLLLVQLF